MRIFGASGHGAVVLDSLTEANSIIDCFIDDRSINEFLGYPVLQPSVLTPDSPFCIAIGDNSIRQKIAERFKGYTFRSVIHPRATISKFSALGDGTVVMAGAIINACTKIGDHVILNTNSSIDHDCTIEDYVHVAPGATVCGGVNIGKGSFIGAGATILPNLKIGANVIIAAGSVVVQSIPSGVRVKGTPAREF